MMILHNLPPPYVVAVQYDLHLCAYTALLRIVAQFHKNIFSDPDSPTGLNKVRIVICEPFAAIKGPIVY